MDGHRSRLIRACTGSYLPGPLPAGYTPLTYVENPLGNSAYIKTGIVASTDMGFYIDALSYDEITGVSGGPYGCLFGGRRSSNAGDFQMTTYTATGSGWSGTFRRGNNNNNYNAHIPYQTRFQASLVGNTYSTGGSDYTTSYNLGSGEVREIYIFALNNNGTATQNGHLRIYSFWLTKGGTKVIDYYPCSRNQDGTVGFYDLVNEVFVPPFTGTLYGA